MAMEGTVATAAAATTTTKKSSKKQQEQGAKKKKTASTTEVFAPTSLTGTRLSATSVLATGGAFEDLLQQYESEVDAVEAECRSLDDYVISNIFPPSMSIRADCRMQLQLALPLPLEPGCTVSAPTTCIIAETAGTSSGGQPRFLHSIANPNLNVLFQEQPVRPAVDGQYRLNVTISNITGERMVLPRGTCVGYLLIK